MSHKEHSEELKKNLLNLSDSLSISENTLWNIVEDETMDSLEVCQFVAEEDEIFLTIEQGFELVEAIIKYEDARNLAIYMEG